MRIGALYCYPIKGLSPQSLRSVELEAGSYFPGDRLFALENGPSGFDPAAPVHQPKIKFLMLMRNAKLASLQTRYDGRTGVLTISLDGARKLCADLRDAEGRRAVEEFFSGFCRDELRGAVRLVEAPSGFRFTDSKSGFVSIVNLASVRALGEAMERPVDPLRFRANFYLDDLEAWREFGLVGKTLAIGAVRLEALARIDRCAATGVEPGSGRRDMDVVRTLRERWGHIDCGIYARIAKGGTVRLGDPVTVVT